MKRKLAAAAVLLVAVVVTAAALQASAVGASPRNQKAGAITIQSWLRASPSAYGLSATVDECFKITGAVVDRGGSPTWSNATYTDKADPDGKCADWQPVGGFNLVPPPSSEQHLFTLYATHTMTGAKGTIDITFAGAYNLGSQTVEGVEPMSAAGSWVISGGTGAYAKLRGHGSYSGSAADIDGSTWPHILHTVRGQVYWLK